MHCHRAIILALLLCFLLPVSAPAKVYRYIDANGVERFSDEPPPAGAKIISESGEIEHKAAADQAQQERNQKAAEAIANQPPPPPPPKAAPAAPAVEAGGTGAEPEKKYSRRKHRRKKQIRKEKAEMRKAMEAVEEGKTK